MSVLRINKLHNPNWWIRATAIGHVTHSLDCIVNSYSRISRRHGFQRFIEGKKKEYSEFKTGGHQCRLHNRQVFWMRQNCYSLYRLARLTIEKEEIIIKIITGSGHLLFVLFMNFNTARIRMRVKCVGTRVKDYETPKNLSFRYYIIKTRGIPRFKGNKKETRPHETLLFGA